MPRIRGKDWVFTVNNWTDHDVLHLQLLGESDQIQYFVYGYELAPTTGTPHLQGFVSLPRPREFSTVSSLLPQCHLERAKGKPCQCRDYCIKGNDYEEYGQVPERNQGKRTDFERLKDYLESATVPPTDRDLWENFPSLYGRYKRSVCHIRDLICTFPVPDLGQGELRPWQSELNARLGREPDDRSIDFVVDPAGNSGKSWFVNYYWKLHQKQCQILRVGKRDDMAHFIDPTCRVFFIDVPRGQTEFLQYVILESLKDGYVFSPKYESCTKYIPHNVHVVVMMNENPNPNALTHDRYNIINI